MIKLIASIFAISTLFFSTFYDPDEKVDLITERSVKSNNMTYAVKNISTSINRSVDEVYQFASNPVNFPKWVAFVKSVAKENDLWLAETDLGEIKIEFAPQNDFGIIDHWVTLPDGTKVNNPIRVIANGKGSEIIFTLFWLPERTEEEYNQDAKAVERDLQTLKKILEKQ